MGDSFLLMAALAGFLDESGIVLLFLLAAALHEAGHAAAVHLCSGVIVSLRLTMLGGTLQYRLPSSPVRAAVFIAAAGPLTGLLAAWLFAGLEDFRFAGANLVLSILNLLPVRPLDGGQMLTALLHGSRTQLALECSVCLLLGISGGFLLSHGGGCGLLLVCGALVSNLQKNLQKCADGYKL